MMNKTRSGGVKRKRCCSKVKKSVVKDFNCSLCLNHQHLPFVFPCHLHSACFTCISGMINANYAVDFNQFLDVGIYDISSKCPLCNTQETRIKYDLTNIHPLTTQSCLYFYHDEIFTCPFCPMTISSL